MGSYLMIDQTLGLNEYLTSDNGCFIAIMQGDGNFVVKLTDPAGTPIWASSVVPGVAGGPYRAIMQGDGNFVVYTQNGVPIWASGVLPGPAEGPYFAAMQDDGNFVVYAGAAAPGAPAHPIWSSGRFPPLLGVTASNVVFDLKNAVVGLNPDAVVQEQDLTNDSAAEQTVTFTYECDYTESQKLSITNTHKTSLEMSAGFPILDGITGNLKLSTESTENVTTETDVSTTKKFTNSIPTKVPAHSHVLCRAVVSIGDVSVPYWGDAVYSFLTSGFPLTITNVSGHVKGVYRSSTAYDLQVVWSEPKPLIPLPEPAVVEPQPTTIHLLSR